MSFLEVTEVDPNSEHKMILPTALIPYLNEFRPGKYMVSWEKIKHMADMNNVSVMDDPLTVGMYIRGPHESGAQIQDTYFKGVRCGQLGLNPRHPAVRIAEHHLCQTLGIPYHEFMSYDHQIIKTETGYEVVITDDDFGK